MFLYIKYIILLGSYSRKIFRNSHDSCTLQAVQALWSQVSQEVTQRVESIAQLNCICTNAHKMGKNQEETEAIVLCHGDVVTIMETWWGDCHGWSGAMDGYKLLRRDMQGRRDGGMALYIREYFNCVELKDGDDKAECLWVRTRDMANKAVILRGVSYRPPCQDEEADEACKPQGDVSRWLVPVLVQDFNLLDICIPKSVLLFEELDALESCLCGPEN